jgi:hypothetical protein
MKDYTMNIGLENNPFKANVIPFMVAKKIGNLNRIASRVNVGEWDGKPERTIVLSFECNKSNAEMVSIITDLCVQFTQDAIPFKSSDYTALVYNPDYKSEKYIFDPNFYIDY